jgi:hypothetical protein
MPVIAACDPSGELIECDIDRRPRGARDLERLPDLIYFRRVVGHCASLTT